MSHQIKDFSASESAKLSQDIQVGKKILSEFSKNASEKVNAKILDQTFKGWAESNNRKIFTTQQIADGLGTIFGELLKADFSFAWRMIEDDHGLEPALVDEKTGSIVFPVNTVWKRIEPEINPRPFFEAMWKAIKAHLENQKGK